MGLERRPARLTVSAVLTTSLAACALGGGMLGGRETCWPDHEQRAASLWRGVLVIDATGSRLDTPEGDVIPLLPGELSMELGHDGSGLLVRGDEVVALAGDDVTLFGGAGADGNLVVCAVESNRGGG
jgi:hypothetical protein